MQIKMGRSHVDIYTAMIIKTSCLNTRSVQLTRVEQGWFQGLGAIFPVGESGNPLALRLF